VFAVPGYQTLELLYESMQSLILRAIRDRDQQAVIIKVLNDVHPPPERIARFKREYQLVQALELPGVVAAYDFLQVADHWLFVQEDFGGDSLARLGLAGRLDTAEFLALAARLAGHLAGVHQQGIIHKDINPANIVLSREAEIVKLIDFGIATRLPREIVTFDHPSLVEGTPAYLSPEQTGRINQPLDYRTDLYSLGCTFYELLTGQPPFAAETLIELLHCHLARTPEPLSRLRPDVPPTVAAIIDKLLAKEASARYQSARGLEADLQTCHAEWQRHGSIAWFEPGARDVFQRIMSPARLYGREDDTAQLLAAFERVADGASEVLLVSGDPGVGKSALVKELYRPVTSRRGFFVSGKFDQFQRDTPYQPILEALDRLIGQVLMEPPERLATWASSLREAAGVMLPALVDIVARLELLYERIPPLPALTNTAFDFLFKKALIDCIRVFAAPEHPLVLFIDDLQWADSTSLDLLERLLTNDPIPHLLIVGAYRHREVLAAHPMRVALNNIHAAGAQVRELHLAALAIADTTALLGDLLHRSSTEIQEPAALIHRKTGGNPFFIQILLDTLTAEEALYFDHESGSWRWHMQRLQLLELSDNVVDLVIANLQKLPEDTRGLLTQAACIGNHFELGLLAAVTETHPHAVARALMPALTGNYLIPTTGDYRLMEADVDGLHTRLDVGYKFAHDRIQQAAYGLSAPGSHATIHARIGRGMRVYYTGQAAEVHLLDTVNQLNLAHHLIDDAGERRDLAAMNLAAGKKAKAAVAHAAAIAYFEHGLRFLEPPSEAELAARTFENDGRAFDEDYDTALALTEEAAEAAYLAADFAAMDRYIATVLERAKHFLNRIKATQIRVNALVRERDFSTAIKTAGQILEELGIALPDLPTEGNVTTMFQAVAHEMGTRNPHDLLELSEMDDGRARATLHILDSIYTPAFVIQPVLSILVAGHMVLTTLRHGLAEEATQAFIYYGMALCSRDQLHLGYEFGCLAETLAVRRRQKSQIPAIASLGVAYIFHWRRPNRDTIQLSRDGYRAGLECGNIIAGGNSLQGSVAMGFWTGRPLSEVDEEYVEVIPALRRQGHPFLVRWASIYHQAVRKFRGVNDEPLLPGKPHDESLSLLSQEQELDQTYIYNLNFNEAILAYHFHEYRKALGHARSLTSLNQAGALVTPIANLYHCLSLLASYDAAAPEEQPVMLDEARELVTRMQRWGEIGPENYSHKYHLMAADLCRVTGRRQEAREHYDRAADLAREHQYTHEEGLAFERAALFYLERQNPRLAGYYMRDAYYAYERWGANAKLAFLRRHYGYLLERESSARARTAAQMSLAEPRSATTTASDLGDLDLGTVLAATRAIARETDVGSLLQTIMRVSLENAGAERGYLLLVRYGRLLVKARGELGGEYGADARFEAMSLALGDQQGLAHSVVQYVARTGEPVLLDHAAADGMFVHDPHIRDHACKSLLCVPIRSQGRLVAITYLENNRATSVFNDDRLDVLTLLMGQAAVSLENALLRDAQDLRDFHFRVGGSLPADSPTYVRRAADELLTSAIRQGEYCYVFNTRQMGKSSLRVRAVERLGNAGVACASIDLTAIGSHHITAQQWYAGLARALVTGLGLQRDIDLRRWWREHEDISPVQRLDALVDEEILAHIDGPVAVFIDEVDAVLGLDFNPDDFFALVRLFYNRRAEDLRYRKLSVTLLGVATPADLIRDKRRTPFNIGRAIPLAGFRLDEAHVLQPGLDQVGDGQRLLRAVLDWTSGQPFLTQKLCRLIAEDESRPPAGKEREWVANLVRTRIIDKWRQYDEPEHLGTIEARILQQAPGDVAAVLARYRTILDHDDVQADDSPVDTTLLLSGLVARTFDRVHVGNSIYAAVFDRQWIAAALAR
jgi:predicted ATPase